MACSCPSPEHAALGEGRQNFLEATCQGTGGEAQVHRWQRQSHSLEGASPPLAAALKAPQTHMAGDKHEFPLGSLVTLIAHRDPSRGAVHGDCPSAPSRPHGRLGPPPLAEAGPPRPARRGVPAGLPRAVGGRPPSSAAGQGAPRGREAGSGSGGLRGGRLKGRAPGSGGGRWGPGGPGGGSWG